MTRGDVAGFEGGSFAPGEVCEGLCGVCGWSEGISIVISGYCRSSEENVVNQQSVLLLFLLIPSKVNDRLRHAKNCQVRLQPYRVTGPSSTAE